jgi:hypothetical protein
MPPTRKCLLENRVKASAQLGWLTSVGYLGRDLKEKMVLDIASGLTVLSHCV